MANEILIAIITGIIALIASIITSIYGFRYEKKLNELKDELEKKKESDFQAFKFLLSYETNKANEILVHLKDYLSSIQTAKDRLKQIAKMKVILSKNDLIVKLSEVRELIITGYSSALYYLDDGDFDRNAHSIKNLLIECADLIEDELHDDNLNFLIDQINRRQEALRKSIDSEIELIVTKLYAK